MTKRTGNQIPSFQHVTDYDRSDADLAVQFFESLGFSFLPWQKYQMELMLAKVEIDGFEKVASKSIGFSVGRQNGKSFACRLAVIWFSVILGKSCLYSAHHSKTCNDFFNLLKDIFTNKEKYPDLYDSVALDSHNKQRINSQRGSESIYFKNGGCITFQTRTKSGARGSTVNFFVCDETQELTEAQFDAMKPTLSAGGADSMSVYVGTPNTSTNFSPIWQRMHDNAHSDNPGNTWWIEWAYEGDYDENLTPDELFELAWDYNPAMGLLLDPDNIKDEAETMTILGFFQERLGWWQKGIAGDAIFTPDEWNSSIVSKPPDLKEQKHIICYGIKISPDDREVALCVAIRTLDEKKKKHIYVELREVRAKSEGMQWIVDFLVSRKENTAFIVIDGRNGAEKLKTDLLQAGISKLAVKVADTNDAISASSLLKDLNNEGFLTHCPSQILDDSAFTSQKRLIGNSGAYTYQNGFGDATPLSAAALATYAAYTTKRNPKRKSKIL